jgi:metal-responsive CopG/Arc/MetJ family transcriptional regulator
MRTIVNLPKEQIQALDQYGKKHRVSRTEVVRQAVAAFLPAAAGKDRFQDHPAFGSMKTKVDSVKYIRRLRSEWDR